MDTSLWHVLQTTDSAFPVGGFGHSYGLEGLVQDGRITTPAELEQFLAENWLPSLAHIDFPLIRLAHSAAGSDAELFHLDELAWAVRPTSEIRKAQQQMGRQRLRLVALTTGMPRLMHLDEAAQADAWRANWPVVCGAEAGLLGIESATAMTASAYQGIAGLLAASAKLIRIGPTEIQGILARQRDGVVAAIDTAQAVGIDDIGWFTPHLDIASARHETAYTRIFIS
ncbi:MAG TPA: urease accessory UreF family protein [Kiritimatiellia bacterium]|nr:urease accessory UreF family protein [Kiritimatiellia bacterium]HMP34144.1 urease accessory UreF family protein [Kiritimatiellia bacterium]